ncbi:MAG: hypothetical protein KDD53_05730 [Bdellovibrionales bacterium]|nr:hypothetical protein [Bdellovibrionales bacterium]
MQTLGKLLICLMLVVFALAEKSAAQSNSAKGTAVKDQRFAYFTKADYIPWDDLVGQLGDVSTPLTLSTAQQYLISSLLAGKQRHVVCNFPQNLCYPIQSAIENSLPGAK